MGLLVGTAKAIHVARTVDGEKVVKGIIVEGVAIFPDM